MIELGTIPVGVPQKRFLLVINPLSVPCAIQCSFKDDGEDPPLVLNIDDVDDLLPITVKDPIRDELFHEAHEEIEDDCPSVHLFSPVPSQCSYKSVEDDTSVFSSEFETQIMASMNATAKKVVHAIRAKKFYEKSEVNKRVLNEAVQALLSKKYFKPLDAFKNYTYMDWNAIPSDPKELYCNNEIIHLSPNKGATITILVIPNITGYYNKYLQMRICPLAECIYDEFELPTLVDSELMTSKFWIEYTCKAPEINFEEQIWILDKKVHVGEQVAFDMVFRNDDTIGGFVYYDVVVGFI